jgi:hypothetical protein
MRASVLITLLLGSLISQNQAVAEGGTCPNGYYPINGGGVSGCAPIPGYNQQRQSRSPGLPAPRWEDRWGAIVTDANKGVVGSATGKRSRSEAKRAAIADCESREGRNCTVQMVYENGCASLIVGDDIFHVTADATKEDAERVGIESCSGKTTNCRAFFTACSPPVRIR